MRSNGEIKWGGELIFISEVLIGELVGISETETGEWLVLYADIELGFIDKTGRRLCRRRGLPSCCRPVDLSTTLSR